MLLTWLTKQWQYFFNDVAFFIKKLQNKFKCKKLTNQYQIKTSCNWFTSPHFFKKKNHKPTHEIEKGTDPLPVETQALAAAGDSHWPTSLLLSHIGNKQISLWLCLDWKQTFTYIREFLHPNHQNWLS